MIDLIIKNAKVATASDVFNCDIGIDKEKIVFLEKLWKLITEHHISLIPKTKHKILEDILVNLTIDYDKKTDTSASSTVTKLGAFKILAGLEKRDKYSGK